jgi:GntP family gluconate:H+ symporter
MTEGALAPLMFASLLAVLLTGFPVAFGLMTTGIVFGLIAMQIGIVPPEFFNALPLRLFGIMMNEVLLAIPFFTFMGLILERSRMAEDLLDTIGQVFGPLRSGLAIAVVFVGALLAATTGVVAASVIAMGLISLPIMLRYGYNRPLAAGVITAAGTLAQIIPPSIVLIVIADQLGQSVGDMYRAAFIPAFGLVGIYVLAMIALAFVRPQWVPALPPEARVYHEADGSSGHKSLAVLALLSAVVLVLFFQNYAAITVALGADPADPVPVDETIVISLLAAIFFAFVLAVFDKLLRLNLLSELARRVTFVLIPPLLLIFLVLGTIFLGVATPTEGGAMGAAGAMIMAMARKRLSYSLLKQALDASARLAIFVLFILIGATTFGLTFQAVDGPIWVKALFAELPGGQLGFVLFVNALVFLLGFFIDFFEIAFILLPLLLPVATLMEINLIWFGVMVAMNLQTSFLTPPFGFALFYLRSVAPKADYVDRVTGQTIAAFRTIDIYKGALAFVVLQVIMLAIIIFNPEIVLIGLGERPVLDIEGVDLFQPFGEEEVLHDEEELTMPGAEGEPAAEESPSMDPFEAPPAEEPAPQR